MSKSEVSLVFVSSNFRSWHGLDLLLDVLSQTTHTLTLTVVGSITDTHLIDSVRILSDSHWFSYMKHLPDNLLDFYSSFDLGISSLALDRIFMQDACPLKSREYLSFGLPVIGTYNDDEVLVPYYQKLSQISVPNILTASAIIKSYSRQSIIDYATSSLTKSKYLIRLN